MKLLSVDTNAKTKKGQSKGYLTGILYLAPANLSGRQVCPHRSAGCELACLYSAGMGALSNVQAARVAKTLAFFKDRAGFVADIEKDIIALVKKAKKAGMKPCVRLNGTSDIPWHNMDIMQAFPDVPFYDYTPNKARMLDYLDGKLPSNYSLTFSRKEDNESACLEVMERGGNVAAVFKNALTTWKGKPCFDGDQSDLRFLDPKGVIIALKAKGKAKKDTSGFVIQ
jgi:hypothetical protein